MVYTINSFWNSLFAVLSARILCLAHTLALMNSSKQGEKGLRSPLLPHSTPALCPLHPQHHPIKKLPNVHLRDLRFQMLQVETFISHPRSVQGQAVLLLFPLGPGFQELFLLCIGGSRLDPPLSCSVLLQAQRNLPCRVLISWCSQMIWEAGSWYKPPLHNCTTEKFTCLLRTTCSQAVPISRQSISYSLDNLSSSFLGPL